MDKRIGTPIMLIALAVGAMLAASGCASTEEKSARHTGTERGATASNTMASVESDIRLVVVDINATGLALTALLNPAQEDTKAAYEAYTASVAALVASSAVYLANSEKMGEQGRDFFDEWRIQGTTYVNPQIRSLSEQRRGEISVFYTQIAESSVGVKGSLKTYVTTIQEIKTYFSTDLTPKGVQAISTLAFGAIEDGYSLNTSFEGVLGSISAVRVELASSDAKL